MSLHVKVLEAKGLPNFDRINIYIQFLVDEEGILKSTNKSSSCNPVWNQEFDFNIINEEKAVLKVVIFNFDEQIGVIDIPIKTINNFDQDYDKWYKIQNNSDLVKGSIHLVLNITKKHSAKSDTNPWIVDLSSQEQKEENTEIGTVEKVSALNPSNFVYNKNPTEKYEEDSLGFDPPWIVDLSSQEQKEENTEIGTAEKVSALNPSNFVDNNNPTEKYEEDSLGFDPPWIVDLSSQESKEENGKNEKPSVKYEERGVKINPQQESDDDYENEDLKEDLSHTQLLPSAPGSPQNQMKCANCAKLESEISKQTKKIDQMKSENTQLKHENTQLKHENTQLKHENTQLKHENIQLKHENTQLKHENTQLENENTQPNDEDAQLENENANLKNEIQKLKQKIIELNEKIGESNKAKKEKDGYNNEFVCLKSEDVRNLREIREISSGASGKVLEVAKEVKYALKVMHMREIDGKKLRHFMKEYEILNHLHHPNIIRTFGISLDSDSSPPSILLEFCPRDLHSLIKEKPVSNIQLAFIIYQIIEGMKYVHSCRIIHRDIKPSNILITEGGIIKICDFGISKLMSIEEQSQTSIFGGTQKFMAPELIDEHDDYDEKVDVYSFGVLLFFLLSKGEMPKIKISEIVAGKKADIPSGFTDLAKELVSSCWNFESSERPSFEFMAEKIEKNGYKLVELLEIEQLQLKDLINIHKNSIPNY